MKLFHRALTTLTATAFLCVAGAALAAPAQADVDLHLILVDTHADGTIDLGLAGNRVISLPDPVDL
ncbi:hypothetical protein [Streptomyces triculaminicus]|uniref:hypothetical protein n=1 Tax=Streptomyces triculaminicus TaxID=2816232 RepID=UPI0037CDD399